MSVKNKELISERIKTKVPFLIKEVIKKDAKNFSLNNNLLCNTIFSYYLSKRVAINLESNELDYDVIFNLSSKNFSDFQMIFKEKVEEFSTKSNFMRCILSTYCNHPEYIREQIIFNNIYKDLDTAIKLNCKVKIELKDKGLRDIDPYFLVDSANGTRNYLVAYCHKANSIRSFRLKNIKGIVISELKQLKKDGNYISKLRENFDPYLSYGNRIKVRLTDLGKNMLETNYIDRPVEKEVNGDVYTFEASELKAKIYFSSFFEEAEVLEPKSLRNWFIKKYERAYSNYLSD